jgi:hypothetical protein
MCSIPDGGAECVLTETLRSVGGSNENGTCKRKVERAKCQGLHHGNAGRSKFFFPDFVAHRFAVSANG